MIEIKNLTFKYREGDTPTIHDINLRIPDGQFVGITGAAGSGKSTLTYAFNGIIPHCYPGDFYGSVEAPEKPQTGVNWTAWICSLCGGLWSISFSYSGDACDHSGFDLWI